MSEPTPYQSGLLAAVLDAVPLGAPGRTANKIHAVVQLTYPAISRETVVAILASQTHRGKIHARTKDVRRYWKP